MNSHKVIVPYIEERVSKFAWTPSAKVSVVVSSLGDYAALYGLEYCLRKKINILLCRCPIIRMTVFPVGLPLPIVSVNV